MPTETRTLLFSIKPRYVHMLLAGTKTVELRRTLPSARPGSDVMLYASSPACELVGRAKIAQIFADTPGQIWDDMQQQVGVTREEFDAYFRGAGMAVAIQLSDVEPLPRRRPLQELRNQLAGFRPPQSFRYLDSEQVAALI